MSVSWPVADLSPGAVMHCDLLVIGSGAAGLAAAVTAAHHGLAVTVVEKDEVFGGATAWSGGWMWVPGNPLARRAGIHEDPQQPRTYLKNELGDRYDPQRIDAFLDHCGPMVEFFERHTRCSSSTATAYRTSTARCQARPVADTR